MQDTTQATQATQPAIDYVAQERKNWAAQGAELLFMFMQQCAIQARRDGLPTYLSDEEVYQAVAVTVRGMLLDPQWASVARLPIAAQAGQWAYLQEISR